MEAEARDILGVALEGETKTIVDFLAHPESVEIEPERLGATARTADL